MNLSGHDPPLLTAMAAFFTCTLGFMGVTLADLLDRGYELPAALIGSSVAGLVAAGIAVWFLHQLSRVLGAGGPQPPMIA
jgi:hypothetical protein